MQYYLWINGRELVNLYEQIPHAHSRGAANIMLPTRVDK